MGAKSSVSSGTARPFAKATIEEVNMAAGSKDNSVDDEGIFGKLFPNTVDPLSTIVGSIAQDEYSKFSKRGKCCIFNHEVFEKDTGLKERKGAVIDASRLYCRFRDLGFDTDVLTDLTVGEVNAELVEISKEDHTDNSCFVCCIMSHGEHGLLYAKDGKYPVENVFAPFRGDVCKSLLGKPKIFFIQACQGEKFDDGVDVVCKESIDSISYFKIPTQADFLIVYSTVPGFYSWRNPDDGSWFIQALSAVLEHYAKDEDKDIIRLLTIVNRIVAFNFESCTRNADMNRKKQVPFITSTLTRNFKFS